MASLVLCSNTVSVRTTGNHLELIQRDDPDNPKRMQRRNVPLFDVDRVMIMGRPHITTHFLYLLLRNNIPTSLLSSKGKWLGTLCTEENANAARRLKQYELHHDPGFNLRVARKLVYAKIRNARRALQRLAANRKEAETIPQMDTIKALKTAMDKAWDAKTIDELRGHEGLAAAQYFNRLKAFFPENVPFAERSRRPPRDAANALLSWTYAIVQGEIDGQVRAHGLDACIGCLHSVSHGTPSLVLDFLEPLRAPCCDLLVLNILNHKTLNEDHFEFHADDGGTYLSESARKPFFYAYEQAMTRLFRPTSGEYHVDFRAVIRDQIANYLRAMEGHHDYDFFHMP
jgi:CRISPR-associated protein Cas1